MADILKGADKEITINVKDSGGSNIDLSTYRGYGVILYYESDEVEIEKYSKNSVSGWNSTEVNSSDEANGNIGIRVLRSITSIGRSGADVWAEVVLQRTLSDYEANRFQTLAKVKAFTFVDTTGTTIPNLS